MEKIFLRKTPSWPTTAWILLGLAFGIRLAALIATDRLVRPEEWEYEQMAMNLLSGHGLVYHVLGVEYKSFTGPIYPALCAAVYAVTYHSQTVLVLLQAFLSSAIAVLVAKIGWDLFGPLAAWSSGLLTALHPGLVIYTTKLHALTLDAFLFTALAGAILRLRQQPSSRPWRVCTGVVLGLSVLSRPTILLFVPFLVFWFMSNPSMNRMKTLRMIAAVLAIGAAVVGPWTYRNYRIHHRFVLVQSTAGLSFWKGNNPYATGGNLDAQGRSILELTPPSFQEQMASASDELEQEHFFWREGWQYVLQHPADSIRLLGKKWIAFWWFSPQSGQKYPTWQMTVYQWWYAFALIFALVGLWGGLTHSSPAMREAVGLLVLLCLAIALAQSLFYVEGRHRWAIEPLLLVLTGKGIASMIVPALRVNLRYNQGTSS